MANRLSDRYYTVGTIGAWHEPNPDAYGRREAMADRPPVTVVHAAVRQGSATVACLDFVAAAPDGGEALATAMVVRDRLGVLANS